MTLPTPRENSINLQWQLLLHSFRSCSSSSSKTSYRKPIMTRIPMIFPSTFHQCKVRVSSYLKQCLINYFTGYESSMLFAEADTRLFQTNETSTNYLFIEEVKIFLNNNNGSKTYLRMDNDTGVVQLSNASNEASLFTLVTTPELHMTGQFLLAHKMENVTLEASTLVMRFDISSSQNGPFQLVTKTEQPNFYYLEVRGRSTTLPAVPS